MSGSATNFAGTLTGGIQDISALLPIIGTDQCEQHVGSALEGGFLYAVATPLSLFGSLGIVKAGISVLVASISIPKPSLGFTPIPELSLTSSRRLWCGARVLDNAGFKLVGSVAPLIGMDGKRYKAESRLIEILEKKHIDTPENLSVDWRSAEWNISLVIGTVVAALINGTPYLYLLLKDSPESIHSPWAFPFLRTLGSCLTTVCCQFLIQFRVISLMKSRIIFMIMHRHLIDDLKKSSRDESILKEQEKFGWDESFPAEECLWSLKQHLLSLGQVSLPYELGGWLLSNPRDILQALWMQHARHFHTPKLHRIFIIISWLLLLVSLPAAVAGYIGCFTLVTNSRSSGPLVWLGLEAALSALRILLWAWNPSFDERTGVDVRLKLTEKSLVTTQWDIDALQLFNKRSLIPERRFLEQITPYTGPIVHFNNPDDTALYFVLTVDKEHSRYCLFMTVLDLTNRTAVTLYHDGISRRSQALVYANTSVTADTDSGEMLATVRWGSVDHPQRLNISIYHLVKYYNSLSNSLSDSLNRSKTHYDSVGPVASLCWGWNLVPQSENETRSQESTGLITGSLTEYDLLCLQQSHEHHLKTRLVEIWGKWIVDGVEAMYRDGCNDLALANPTSDEAKRELYAFNVLLVQEWTKRELNHLQLSAALENVLHSHVQQNAEKLAKEERKMMLSLEWSYDLQKQRLESERAKVKARGKTIVEKRSEQNEFASIWQAGQAFVEKKWTAAVESASFEEGFSEVATEHEWFGAGDDEMRALVEKLKPRFPWWNDQCSCERREMEATVERISKADAKQLEQAYEYTESSPELAAHIYSRHVFLGLLNPKESAFVAKVSSATVYDVRYTISSADVIRTVAEKSSCRSLINVDLALIAHIPENDNLLFCSKPFDQEIDLIQRNRNRWWEQQNTNSWTFYLSPWRVDSNGQYVYKYYKGAITHIMIFLLMPARLRLHLLHCRGGDVELSIQENDREIRHVRPAEISKDKLVWQDYDLDWVEPGRHELQLVVSQADYWYKLRDLTGICRLSLE